MKKSICIKNHVVLTFLLLGMGALTLGIMTTRKTTNLEVFNVNVQTEAGIKDELIIAMFIQDIEEAVKEYYQQSVSRDVEIYNYEITIVAVEKLNQKLIQIKFGVTPQVGAHNPVGYDEVTYTIDANGNKQFVDYRHVKTNKEYE